MISQQWSRHEIDEAMDLQRLILQMIAAIGCDVGKVSKEALAARTVSEIYSAPRVTSVAKLMPSLGIAPGFALYLGIEDSNGREWGFDQEEGGKQHARH